MAERQLIYSGGVAEPRQQSLTHGDSVDDANLETFSYGDFPEDRLVMSSPSMR